MTGRIFSLQEDFTVCWNLNTTLQALDNAGSVPDMIIVGIGNTSNRTCEYNYGSFVDVYGKTQEGIVENYAQFVITELMPYIEANYRVLTGPANTTIMGGLLRRHGIDLFRMVPSGYIRESWMFFPIFWRKTDP